MPPSRGHADISCGAAAAFGPRFGAEELRLSCWPQSSAPLCCLQVGSPPACSQPERPVPKALLPACLGWVLVSSREELAGAALFWCPQHCQQTSSPSSSRLLKLQIQLSESSEPSAFGLSHRTVQQIRGLRDGTQPSTVWGWGLWCGTLCWACFGICPVLVKLHLSEDRDPSKDPPRLPQCHPSHADRQTDAAGIPDNFLQKDPLEGAKRKQKMGFILTPAQHPRSALLTKQGSPPPRREQRSSEEPAGGSGGARGFPCPTPRLGMGAGLCSIAGP